MLQAKTQKGLPLVHRSDLLSTFGGGHSMLGRPSGPMVWEEDRCEGAKAAVLNLAYLGLSPIDFRRAKF